MTKAQYNTLKEIFKLGIAISNWNQSDTTRVKYNDFFWDYSFDGFDLHFDLTSRNAIEISCDKWRSSNNRPIHVFCYDKDIEAVRRKFKTVYIFSPTANCYGTVPTKINEIVLGTLKIFVDQIDEFYEQKFKEWQKIREIQGMKEFGVDEKPFYKEALEEPQCSVTIAQPTYGKLDTSKIQINCPHYTETTCNRVEKDE